MACDIATILRKHHFVAREAANVLWRQGVSGLDVALASSLSDPQRLDLIDAVDQLNNRSNLSNRKENIMSPDEDNKEVYDTLLKADEGPIGPFNPVSTVIEQDEENDCQREQADENLDPDLVHLTDDEPEGEPSDADTRRLHVALKDPPNTQDGYVSESDTERDQTPEERQADLDKCCGSDPIDDPDRERLTVNPLPADMPPLQPLLGLAKSATKGCCNRDLVREFVYKLIDGEREYQDNKFDQAEKNTWTPHDWLALIDGYVYNARDIVADPNGQMDEIRKICALAVHAMERIATPARM